MTKRTPLYRKTAKAYDKAYGTFDLETYGLGGEFADAGTWGNGAQGDWEWAHGQGKRHRTVEDLFHHLMHPNRGFTAGGNVSKRKFTWYAHNGAGYDFSYIICQLHDYAKELGVEVDTVCQGQKMIAMIITTPDGKISIEDTYPLMQCSLDAAAKTWAPHVPKLKGSIDFDAGEIYDPENPDHVAYMMRDCEALYEAVDGFNKMYYEAFGVLPAMTAGGSALKAWRATIPEGHVYYRANPKVEAFLHNFKRGGLVWPGSTCQKVEDMVTVDRTAAYAAVMREGGFPTSVAIEVDEYVPDMLGFYHVLVTVPSSVPVPMFCYKGQYPYGTFETYCSSELLEFGKQFGVTWEIIKGYVYERTEDVFGAFIDKCELMEYPLVGEVVGAIKNCAKISRNALSGKFGKGSNSYKLVIAPLDKPAETLEELDQQGQLLVDEESGDLLPYVRYPDTEAAEIDYIHPEWYSLMTERQRREMIRLMSELKPEDRGKVDTDSFTAPRSEIERLEREGKLKITRPGEPQLEHMYGTYKIEHDWQWLLQLGPKNYQGYDRLPGRDGNPVGVTGKCKGISNKMINKDPEIQQLAAAGTPKVVTMETVKAPIQVLAGRLETPGTTMTRTPGTPWTVNAWDLDDEGWFHHPVVTPMSGL